MADDLSRWLRAVRPHTAADDDWNSTLPADELLAAIHERVSARRAPARVWRRPRVWAPVAAFAAVAAVVVAATVPGSATHRPAESASHGVQSPQLPTARPAAMELASYDSCADLLAGLRAHTAAHVQAYGFPGQDDGNVFDTIVPFAAGANATAGINAPSPEFGIQSSSSSGTSTTNDQEVGVDEPDIVKTDGNRVITITDGVLRVVDADTRQITGTLDLTVYSGWQGAQLLVSGNQAVVLLSAGEASYQEGIVGGFRSGPEDASGKTTALFVDLSRTPTVVGSLRASGGYLDARLIGSTMRLVITSAPAIAFPASSGSDSQLIARNKKIVEQAPLSAWLPSYTVQWNGATSTSYVPCDAVSHPADYTGTSMVTIYTLNFAHLNADPQPISVAADGDTVYSSSTSLYVASDPNGVGFDYGDATRGDTELHRFDVTGSGPPTYLGSGDVPGQLLSQYSLSDYAGYLRVAVSVGVDNRIYVLNADTLKVDGQVGRLGLGERIYAVRFLGPLAYVVTFQQTDPLYILDLSTPSRPKVAGSVLLTGYSDYLHDAGDGRIIGVGQQANAEGRVAGLQVSLFDVRNPAHPTRTGQVVLPDAQNESTLDPHAFLYWPATGLVVVPTQAWDPTESGKVLVARVDGDGLIKVGVLANPLSTTADDGLGIQRSLIVNGALWTISGSGIQVSDQTTLHRQAWIGFS